MRSLSSGSRGNRIKLFLIGALLGAVCFTGVYGVRVLDPAYDDWLLAGDMDLRQHYIGFCHFRQSRWQFPIGLIETLSYPMSMSVIYTDSIPLLAVWILTGLWHSTGWNYVVWGLYWGTLIICATVFAPEYKKLAAQLHINTEAGSWKLFQMARTFILFVIGRILTIPGDLAKSWMVFRKLFTDFHPEGFFDASLYTRGLDRPNFLLGLVCIFILWAASMLQRSGPVRERLAGSNIVFRWAAYYLLFFAVIIFGIYGPGYDASSFVYMQY